MEFQAGAFEAVTEFDEPMSGPVERRSERRREGVADFATLQFRGVGYVVPVLNISTRGTMVESDLAPRLGESVMIRFAGCSPIYAFVRWMRDGRLGLNFGCELTIG
ncbi:MAG TPA: hypothetical protein VN231_09095 [Allosphingosinicella sp.]|nr:hypothetical protein [Allosphingosinicella sp.]